MKLEYVIFFGPYVLAGILALIALSIWRRNLGSTRSAWVLIGCSVLLFAVGLYFPIGIWLGDQ